MSGWLRRWRSLSSPRLDRLQDERAMRGPTAAADQFAENRRLLLEHDLFRKPVSTFRDHALRLARLERRLLAGWHSLFRHSQDHGDRHVGAGDRREVDQALVAEQLPGTIERLVRHFMPG